MIIIILRETGVLNLNYYKVNLEANSGNSWTDKSLLVTIDSSMMGTQFVNSLFGDLPITVLCGSDTLYKEISQQNSIIVTIDTLQNGFLWTPLYKSSTFKAVGTARFVHDIIKTPPTKISLVKANLFGHLNMAGNISIMGLCSHHQAKKLIKELVVKNFVSQTRQYFAALD
jgi:hypothetical protein